MAKVSLVSLGCPKNLVDSEGALGEIVQAGHEIVVDQSQADVIIVNTCGFIESAKQESVGAILSAIACKTSGTCKAVIVIGCLAQRYAADLSRELHGVDAYLGVEHAGKIAEVIEKALAGRKTLDVSKPTRVWKEHSARIQSTPAWTSYLKISDGCDNRCAYCAIPDIRGPFRSRPESAIIEEAKHLADKGVKEVILLGQDLTQYGADKGQENALARLLIKLNDIESLRWIRLLYCYPTKITPELIDAIAGCERVTKYMDIPLQHGDDGLLKAMNRRGNVEQYEQVIADIRDKCPEMALRSTFIVGFPGETDAAFKNMLAFARKIDFDRVGVFKYSLEDGTPAVELKDRVGKKVAQIRYDKLMRLQQKISAKKNAEFVGKQMEVLVEGRTEDGSALYGRSYRDAPEIDGLVYVRESDANPGDFVTVTITEATEYDLIGS